MGLLFVEKEDNSSAWSSGERVLLNGEGITEAIVLKMNKGHNAGS